MKEDIDEKPATKKDLKDLEERTNQKFDEVDKKFDTVNQRFDEVDKKFDTVNQRFDEVDKKFDTLNKKVSTSVASKADLKRESKAQWKGQLRLEEKIENLEEVMNTKFAE